MTTKDDLLFDKVTEAINYIYSDELLDPVMEEVIHDLKADFIKNFDEDKLNELKETYEQEHQNYLETQELKEEALRSFNNMFPSLKDLNSF